MIEEKAIPEPDCTCKHVASWHLKHATIRGQKAHTIRRGRCLVKVKNERGFPTGCECRTYKPKGVAA